MRMSSAEPSPTVLEPKRQVLSGTCLWLDVTGFSALSEQLSKQGPSGNALLSETLNHLYDEVIDAVQRDTGEVMFFAGDGALCLWQAQDATQLADTVSAAVRAAVHLRAAIQRRRYGGMQLRVRQILVSGALTHDRVGGWNDTWIDILSGSPVAGLASLERRCPAQRVLVCERCVAALGGKVRTKRLAADAFLLRDLWLTSVEPSYSFRGTALVARARTQGDAIDQTPPELRRVSVAFLVWSDYVARNLADLQEVAHILQRASSEHGGRLCQLVHADKGLEGVVVFGLPGHSSGEDAARAVRFARDVTQQLAHGDARPRIGVATGSAFCGSVNGRYCLVGKTVIRAARLATVAAASPLVDDDTAAEALRRTSFSPFGVLKLKGLEREVSAHRVGDTRKRLPETRKLVDRVSEREQLRSVMGAFARSAAASHIAIHGELGIGKSALLGCVPGLARDFDLPIVIGVADEQQQHSAYSALRTVLTSWFGNSDRLARLVAEVDEEGELAALLNPLFASNFRSSSLLAQMPPETRAENRQALLMRLLKAELGTARVVFVIDDAHWMDASSSEMIRYIRQCSSNILWITASRPTARAMPAGDDELHIVLPPLAPHDTATLLATALEASRLSAAFLQRVLQVTQGNPLHSLELCRAFSEARKLELAGETVELALAESESLPLPGTLEALIQSRYDRLSVAARRVLRAASVLGQSFELPLLAQVLAEFTQSALEAAIHEALQQEILQLRAAYEFQHASLQAVIYGLLPPQELRELHARTARALQAREHSKAVADAARLALHWSRAGYARQAADCFGVAAQQALESYANADAVHLFKQALAQDQLDRGELRVDLKRAGWASGMGNAFYSLSRHAEADGAFADALGFCDLSLARNAFTLPLSVLVYFYDVLRGPQRAVRATQVTNQERERHLLALRAIHARGALLQWQGRLFEAASWAFIAYTCARRVVDSGPAAEIFSGLGFLLTLTPARGFAEGEMLRALTIAERTGELHPITSVRVLLGMYYTMNGQADTAEATLRLAVQTAERLGSGLWRHRASFGLAEALYFQASFAAAQAAFAEAARIAADAEQTVVGFANCLAALAACRRGQIREAEAIVSGPTGSCLTAGGPALQRFVALGVHAEVLARCNEPEQALELANEALSLAQRERSVDVYFAGLHGYVAVVNVFCLALSGSRGGSGGFVQRVRLRRGLNVAVQQLERFGRVYPAARSAVEVVRGQARLLSRKSTEARAHFEQASRWAEADRQPYYRLLALQGLEHIEHPSKREEIQRTLAALTQRYDAVLDPWFEKSFGIRD